MKIEIKGGGFFLFFVLIFSLITFSYDELSFKERVNVQEAIERVYYSHRIWPKENKKPKPPFEQVVSPQLLEKKVLDYLKKSFVLEKYYNHTISGEELQEEINRIARNTKDPQMLQEIFKALNNDPYLIAECLARDILSDRLVRTWYSRDERFHKEVRERAENALKNVTSENICFYPEGEYSKIEYQLAQKEEGVEIREDGSLLISLSYEQFLKLYLSLPEKGEMNLLETDDHFAVVHCCEKSESSVKVEALKFSKVPYDEWLKNIDFKKENIMAEKKGKYLIPPLDANACEEKWEETILYIPEPRSGHTLIFTGVEMIVWGGFYGAFSNPDYFMNSGGIYNKALSYWRPTSMGLNCPEPRGEHTAIWTGEKMIIWGGWNGISYFNSGYIYDPQSNSWEPITLQNAPTPRKGHTAVWAIDRMIIWGGYDGTNYLNSGGQFILSQNLWVNTSLIGSPSGRIYHTAIFTGSEMIVWGGYSVNSIGDGARYNPLTDTWIAVSTINAPASRFLHTAIWTGSYMIVWGGSISDSNQTNTGGKYDPVSDTWVSTSTGTNCPGIRRRHTAIWTGSEMIIWGGEYYDGFLWFYLKDGARYNPLQDLWVSLPTTNAPSQRAGHVAIWSGEEMIVWGGYKETTSFSDGGRFNISNNSWVPANGNCPESRSNHTIVWTGVEIIVWGGLGASNLYLNSGGCYNLSLDNWIPTSTGSNCPLGRSFHSAIWTGNEMIVWGGYRNTYLKDGGIYDPITNSWLVLSPVGEIPIARCSHTAIWTGESMIVWGGFSYGRTNTGEIFYPSTNTWIATSTQGDVPSPRAYHTAIWTGKEMIIWGGDSGSYENSGGKYNPHTNSWTSTSLGANVPIPRRLHCAVWTGKEMIVWGGQASDISGITSTGGKYDPINDSWLPTSTINAPSRRASAVGVWNGYEMIIWGGSGENGDLNSGGRYNPENDSWVSTLIDVYCPSPRRTCGVWAKDYLVVWGGSGFGSLNGYYMSGGIYHIPLPPEKVQSIYVSDISGCSDEGVIISWQPPSNWNDNSEGYRSYEILRDGIPLVTNLSETVNSYVDNSGENGISYLYQVKAVNGCLLSSVSNGVYGVDNVGENIDEVSYLNISGNIISWSEVSQREGYKLYRGILSELPNLLNALPEGCIRYLGNSASFDSSPDDPSTVEGRLYWYLVTAYKGNCEGSSGYSTEGERVLNSFDYCPYNF